jgi:iron(III) transport system ATP-binding protein
VQTPLGLLRVNANGLNRSGPVVISVRPEDVELSDDPPANADAYNVTSGIVDQKIFLGEYLDFQVRIGETILLARAHPSLRTPIGDPVHVRMDPEKCIAIADTPAAVRDAA